MPRRGAITAKEIQNLRPADKPYKKGCGDGLLLLVNPDGSKWWRFK
jgi:hypothetical protein